MVNFSFSMTCWEENFFAELGPASKCSNADDSDANDYNEDNDSVEESVPAVQVKSYSDAIESMEAVMRFLEDKVIQMKLPMPAH